jgi:hypothetical protein
MTLKKTVICAMTCGLAIILLSSCNTANVQSRSTFRHGAWTGYGPSAYVEGPEQDLAVGPEQEIR